MGPHYATARSISRNKSPTLSGAIGLRATSVFLKGLNLESI